MMELDGLLPSMVMSPPAVTLTFDRLNPKSDQHTYEYMHLDQKTKQGEIPFTGFWVHKTKA